MQLKYSHMQEEVERLACNLTRSNSKAVNLRQLLNVCITNIMARITIGRRIFNDDSCNCDPRADEFKSMVEEHMALLGVFNIGDFIPPLDWLDLQGLKTKTKKLHKRFDILLSSILEEHKISKNAKHQDLLSVLLSLKETPQEGHELVEEEIKSILGVCAFSIYNNFKSLDTFSAMIQSSHEFNYFRRIQ